MRRGFKAAAERLASTIRGEMGSGPAEPAQAIAIADHLGIDVRAADELIERSRLQELRDLQYDAFSGATFKLPSGRTVVVCNPLNGLPRTNTIVRISRDHSHLLC